MDNGFDRGAAITRSLLGYGVLAGAVYLVVGVALGLTRDGFDFTEHALSLLMLGDGGWMQTANLVVSGLMVVLAAAGFARSDAGPRVAALIGAFGLSLLGGAAFEPDPASGFPTTTAATDATASGVLHLAFGAIGFVCLAAAALVFSRRLAAHGDHAAARRSRGAAVVIAVAFAAGAALATTTAGVLCLWVAVLAGWLWLALASVHTYRTVPHPDADRRASRGTR